MTYYEELGVSPQASDEEIRKAYRQVSRLLHPDLHPNPELRSIAERQMRRINEVHATLCDPLKRREYDERLSTEQLPALLARPPISPAPQSLEKTVPPSMIAGGIFGGLLVFTIMLLWPQVPSPPIQRAIESPRAERQQSEMPKAPGGKQLALASRHKAPGKPVMERVPEAPPLAEASKARTEAREEFAGATPQFSAMDAPIALPASALTLPQPLPLPSRQELAKPGSPATPPLSGVWIAVRERNEVLGPNDYAAEYVEIRIQQEGNFLRGKLRSKYRIPDRLMNPQVNFRFEGKVDEEEFPWQGEGNAAGRIRLSLDRKNTLHMHWKAESLAPNSQLLEGSGKLLRVQTD
ncbi:MAG: J domain-containing protein [Bryobacter sp.]|nr:J domain-containing protein [Bryobacter sp.]